MAVPLGFLPLLAALEGPPEPQLVAWARDQEGTLVWCDSGPDRDRLLELSCRARRLLGAAATGVEAGSGPEALGLAPTSAWTELLSPCGVRVGRLAALSLERAMLEAGMGPTPPHIATDGSMAVCNRCGTMWVPGANPGAGPVTWRELRIRLAGFIQEHRPCGIPRWDGRIGLSPELAEFPDSAARIAEVRPSPHVRAAAAAAAGGPGGEQPPVKAGGPGGEQPPVKAGGPGGEQPPVKAGGPGGEQPPVKAGGPGGEQPPVTLTAALAHGPRRGERFAGRREAPGQASD